MKGSFMKCNLYLEISAQAKHCVNASDFTCCTM